MDQDEREEQIKILFSSPSCAARAEGLAEMEQLYRVSVIGFLRRYAKTNNIAFTSEDLDDVWQDAVLCAIRMLQSRDFEYKNSLWKVLCMLAHRRAVQRFRNQLRRPTVQLKNEESVIDEMTDGMDKLIDEIQNCIGQMSEHIQAVLEADVALYFQHEKWVELKTLCDETQLEASRVRSRRSRGRNFLRSCLEEKGYDVQR